MFIRILPLLIFGSITLTSADSEVQTDWSGGSGVLGPAIDWGDEFYQSSSVNWSGYPGSAQLMQYALEHVVAVEYSWPLSVYSADVNGDGYMDILGAASYGDDITWWENLDGSGTSWVQHNVDGYFDGASSVYSEDLNGDGYMDVLGAAYDADNITWWVNVDGSGTNWMERIIDGDYDGARSVYSEDINGDGFMDVLGAAYWDDSITWWENVYGSGYHWIEHTVDENFHCAESVHSADVNGDGYMDVLGAASEADDITWWENVDGSGTGWTEHTVDGEFDGATSVYSADVNGDGYMDILGAADTDCDITWWENVDGSGTIWTEHPVDGDFEGAFSVYSEDINGDGYMDVLGAALWSSKITWWENSDTSPGIIWTEHLVDGEFGSAADVYSADVNGDGHMDVLGAAWGADEISWWDLIPYSSSGSLESSILDTGCSPQWASLEWSSSEPAGTDLYFQYRTSEDYENMGSWSDTLTEPCNLSGLLDRYFQYRVSMETDDPNSTPTIYDVTLNWDPQGIEDGEDPSLLALMPFSPNPSSSPEVRFSLPEPALVAFSIIDLSGRLVSRISRDEYPIGYHVIQLEELSPGIYFCRMTAGEFSSVRKFIVVQ